MEFDRLPRNNGFEVKKRQIVDASIVSVPNQRNSRTENEQIKVGREIKDWSANKRRQKDMDARWTKKNGKSYFGYKNHVCIDNKYKLVRKFRVTHAALHDSQYLENLLDDNNTSRQVWGADSAYRFRANFWLLV